MFYVVGNNSQMYFDVKEYKPHPFPNAISGSVFDITFCRAFGDSARPNLT